MITRGPRALSKLAMKLHCIQPRAFSASILKSNTNDKPISGTNLKDAPDAREALKSRLIPRMTLSSGSASSLTAPHSDTTNLRPAQRAATRFAVSGNVVITGGLGTLALASARALLEHGASGLSLWDIAPPEPNSAALTALVGLQADFPSAEIATETVDITSEDSVANAVKGTVRTLGSINALCSFAGVVSCSDAISTTPTEFRRVLNVNTTGTFVAAQACAAQMMVQNKEIDSKGATNSGKIGGGSIVLVASISGHRVNFPQPQLAYNVSKGALHQLRNSLAAEWAVHGIRTNSVSPGYMDTILNEGDGLNGHRHIWNERNPMGRMGVPEELTGAVVLCTGRAGRYMNGADVVVDGGQIVF